MASAEELLRDAQYAFHNISVGDSPMNRLRTRRAKSLAMSILKKYPGTSQAAVAHSMLLRFADESYTTTFGKLNPQVSTRETKSRTSTSLSFQKSHKHGVQEVPPHQHSFSAGDVGGQDVPLDWASLIQLLFKTPRVVLIILFFVGTFLVSIFGWLLLVPLALAIAIASPLRALFPAEQRKTANASIARLNAYLKQ